MSRFRVYIKPFDSQGNYLASYIEVTKDIVTLKPISQQLDNSEYDVGIFRNGNFSMILRNDQGKYSDASNLNSIFRYKRYDSKVKITWDSRDYDLLCGFFVAGEGEKCTVETTIFEGLLNDIPSVATIDTQTIEFSVLGYESLFQRVIVPFSTVANGDLPSALIYKFLNQSTITNYLTVSALNITPVLDLAVDDVSGLENMTVNEALNEILLQTNSVLYINNSTVYVVPRTATVDNKFTFYGAAATDGIENIINIAKLRDGLNRTFNFWTWTDTSLYSSDDTSVNTYGFQKKEITSDLYLTSSTSKIQSILNAAQAEFAYPKQEFDLETPISFDALALNLLDRVTVDYPTPYSAADDNPIPRYGQSRYGQVRYPIGQFALTISNSLRFKIMRKNIDPTKQIVTFGLRRI